MEATKALCIRGQRLPHVLYLEIISPFQAKARSEAICGDSLIQIKGRLAPRDYAFLLFLLRSQNGFRNVQADFGGCGWR
jgi:hypothetical protein